MFAKIFAAIALAAWLVTPAVALGWTVAVNKPRSFATSASVRMAVQELIESDNPGAAPSLSKEE